MTVNRRKGAGRVAFLAHRDKFKTLLDQGHSMTAIYEDHGAALGISYWQFGRYVRQYLKPEAPANISPAPPPADAVPDQSDPSSPASPQKPEAPSPAPAKPKGGFSFDPNRGNNLDDLV